MKHYHYLFVAGFLLFSCSETKQGDLPVIPVDIVNNTVSELLLSEITESITAIELELTDESVIDPGNILRIICSDDLVFIAQITNILVFNRNGSFVRSIGSQGQGPGEYNMIWNMTIDETNKRLFVNARSKIICYDWQGKVLMESEINGVQQIRDINYFNNELLAICYSNDKEAKKVFAQVGVYRLNENLQITDSCTILKLDGYFGFSFGGYTNFIMISDSTVYLYYPFSTASVPPVPPERAHLKSVLRDTLYRFENNQLIPDLKLKFKDDGIDGEGNMFLVLLDVFRSSRYIFAGYGNYRESRNDDNTFNYHNFYYDTETGKGYMGLGNRYTDDINQIKRVVIRPFQTNPDMFYYWYTHMNPNDLEEPNPTLYIGTLKK